MNKLFYSFLVISFFLTLVEGAILKQHFLRIVINTPFNTFDEKIYLTGDIPGFCAWQPDCIALKKIGVNSYQTELSLPDDLKILYVKVTRGSWQKEAADSQGRALKNIEINLKENKGLFVYNIINWLDQGPLKATGHIEHHQNIWSPQLKKHRHIDVWLPPGYHQSSKSYPVLYMHDGQNVFNPQTSTFGVDWAVDEVLDRMIRESDCPEAIVVAIFSSKTERYEEYHHYLKGKNYGDFLIETVMPLINSIYRTKLGRENTYLMGSSMGALISFTLLWSKPEHFSKAAGLSLPAFVDHKFVFDFIKEHPIPSLPIKFYMDHGTYGGDSSYESHVQDFYQSLQGLGMSQRNLIYQIFSYANHSETDWARRVHIPLKFLLFKD